MKIKWLRTSLKFFWYYCILENLSPGDETAAILATSYFLLFLLIHAPTTQSVLQTQALLKVNGCLKEAADQK